MIDLSEMAEYVDRAHDDGLTCLVATASKDGHPNLAFKGSVMVWDKDHLAFWERAHGETLAHLRENPRIAASTATGRPARRGASGASPRSTRAASCAIRFWRAPSPPSSSATRSARAWPWWSASTAWPVAASSSAARRR